MNQTNRKAGPMNGPKRKEAVMQQLLNLHEIDQQILEAERQLEDVRIEANALDEGVAGLRGALEQVEASLTRARTEARAADRAVEEKRDTLDRIRGRVNQVRNEKQYSAASLEFDLVKQDLRRLEDRELEKMQEVEDLASRREELVARLDEAVGEAGPRGQEIEATEKELRERLTVLRDRRNNLAIRVDDSALGLYDRIRGGRSQVALAPLTAEAVCGNCFTSVTIQQEMQVKTMTELICCEGCGVILYPEDFKR